VTVLASLTTGNHFFLLMLCKLWLAAKYYSANLGSFTGDYVYGNGWFFDSAGRFNSIARPASHTPRRGPLPR
jgi:hypothetical protein